VRSAGVTQVLIAANVVVFVLMLLTGHADRNDVLYRFGAMPVPLAKDEWWRLFTAMFAHLSFLHLLFNMWALMLFGPTIEERYGRLRFLALYFTAGFLGSALSLTLSRPNSLNLGASGAVFGIFGAWIAFFVRHRKARGAREQLRSLFFLVAINLFIGISSGGHIDNFAHLGGLAGGFVVASALEQSARVKGGARLLVTLGGFAAVVIAGIVAISASNRLI
jgi:membrane associated rhomboid family serine protease